jgi:hypothetical protein
MVVSSPLNQPLKVVDSTTPNILSEEGFVPVSSGPSPLVSPLEHESASGFLDTSLKPEGPVLDLEPESNTFFAVADSVMGLSEVGSEVFPEVQRDWLDPVITGPIFLAPQPNSVESLAPNSVKLSSLATVNTVIGPISFGVYHTWGISLGDNEDSPMDVFPPLDVEYRPLSVTQALSIFQSSPSSPVVDDLAPTLDETHKSQSVKKTQYTTSAYEGFLWRGFLKSRLSRSRGCSSPLVPHLQQLSEVSSAQVSDQERFVVDPQLSTANVASPSYLGCSSSYIPPDDKDGVSNGEEVGDSSLEFTDAIEEDLLRIVKLGCPRTKL